MSSTTTTTRRLSENSEIPPTGVGGWFRSDLQMGPLNFTNPTNGSWWMVQIQPVRPHRGRMKLKSLLNALGHFVSEAGSEQSTNFRWWDSRTRCVLACRLDLNHPPTPVGGISERIVFTRFHIYAIRVICGPLFTLDIQQWS